MSETIYEKNIKVLVPLVHDEEGYFHLIYQTTNLVNGKIYVGKHTTKNPYDSYMGSGNLIKQALEKYGIENFTKEILFCFTTEEDAFLKEEEIVTQEFINRENTYNIVLGGHGYKSNENHPFYGKTPWNKGVPMSDESKRKVSEHKKGSIPWNKGVPMSEEQKKKLSGENHWDNSGERHPRYGKTHTDEAKRRMSESHKNNITSNWKTVQKYDIEGNLICEFPSIKRAFLDSGLNSIHAFRNNIAKNKICNGFYYKLKNND